MFNETYTLYINLIETNYNDADQFKYQINNTSVKKTPNTERTK